MHGTTVLCVRREGKVALIADGQVTMGDHVMKHTARKTRRLYNDKVIAGFAGSTADAITLFERFEGKLQEHSGNLQKAAVELAKEWRKDRALRHLEALLIVADTKGTFILSGNGDGTVAQDQPCSVALAATCVFTDLNHDGKLDLLWEPLASQQLATIFGQGGCNFTPRTDYPIAVGTGLSDDGLPGFVLGDLTGDGLPDLVIRNSVAATPFLTGRRDGTFAPQPDLPIDTSGWPNVWIADVNSDGRADLVSAGPRGIEVYANTCEQ